MRPFTYSIVELNNALRILKEDLLNVPEFHNQIQSNHNVILDESNDSKTNVKREYGLRSDKSNDCKILEALNSCYLYLLSLSNECISFCHALQYPCNITVDETHHETFTSILFLKEYFQEFNDVAQKKFMEIDSLCTLLINFCKTVSPCEAQEVMEAFKCSLEDYQTAITVDWSYPLDAEKLLCVLENVQSSTRSMQSYLWTIKTLVVHNSPT